MGSGINFHTKINHQYANVKKCIENKHCKHLKTDEEILASLIITFTKTGDIKYLEHLIKTGKLEELSDHLGLITSITKIISEKNIKLSEEMGFKILTTFRENQISYKNLYLLLNSMPDNLENNEYLAKVTPQVWIYHTFPSSEAEAMFFIKYQKFFTLEIFEKRIDRLLLSDNIAEAKRIVELFREDTDIRKKNEQKIRISSLCKKANNDTIQQLYKISISDYATNMLLLKCMAKSKEPKKALKFASKISDEDYFMSDAVWRFQNLAVIEALNLKNYDLAKEILESSTPKNRLDYIQQQWMLGWIELEFLKKPSRAIKHFNNLLNNSGYAISLARANYWLGRAYDADDEPEKAKEFYLKATDFPATFYGQEALIKLNIPLKDEIYKKINNIEIIPNFNDTWFNVGVILKKFKFDELGMILMQASMYGKNIQELYSMISNAMEIFDRFTISPLTRYACRLGMFIPQISYPKILPHADNFVSSIIRQESGSIINAISEKDALGIMQIIPETAKRMSKKLGMRYSRHRMLTDKDYNIRLGMEYLRDLSQRFNNDKAMVAAAYNAGPAPISRWISQFGNPSEMRTREEIINWIESITYSQTRDYVMRVIENNRVYDVVYE